MISSLIKSIMAETGLRQTALAEALGVPLDRVKSLTSGKVKKLAPEEMRAFVEKLHVRPEFLATGEGEVLRSSRERAFEDRLALMRDATATATSMELPGEYQDLVRDVIVGSALRNAEVIRVAVERFLVAEGPRRLHSPSATPTSGEEDSLRRHRRESPTKTPSRKGRKKS